MRISVWISKGEDGGESGVLKPSNSNQRPLPLTKMLRCTRWPLEPNVHKSPRGTPRSNITLQLREGAGLLLQQNSLHMPCNTPASYTTCTRLWRHKSFLSSARDLSHTAPPSTFISSLKLPERERACLGRVPPCKMTVAQQRVLPLTKDPVMGSADGGRCSHASRRGGRAGREMVPVTQGSLQSSSRTGTPKLGSMQRRGACVTK